MNDDEAAVLPISSGAGEPKFLRNVGLWILPGALRGRAEMGDPVMVANRQNLRILNLRGAQHAQLRSDWPADIICIEPFATG